ncbi:MAG: phosphoserine phosphatase [Halorubrum sp. J07HR59]|nr:MAG: phosphoserine phosphatase [Halorubrum sp. J07HR59]
MAEPADDEKHDTGLCLDIDGTLYRGGSVFVEALPWLAGASWTRASDRAHLRATVGAVAHHHGGQLREVATRGLLSGVDTLRAAGADQAAKTALETLSGLPTPSADGDAQSDRGRERLRERLLTEYGAAVADRPAAVIRRSLEAVFRNEPAEPVPSLPDQLVTTLSDIATTGVDIALVTDAPAHVARAFADSTTRLDGIVTIVGTRYDRVDGVFTGEFTRIHKGDIIAELADRQGWDRVIAGGDTARDLAMAKPADRFIAVEGHGDIRGRITPRDETTRIEGAETAFIPRGQRLGPVLRDFVDDGEPS